MSEPITLSRIFDGTENDLGDLAGQEVSNQFVLMVAKLALVGWQFVKLDDDAPFEKESAVFLRNMKWCFLTIGSAEVSMDEPQWKGVHNAG